MQYEYGRERFCVDDCINYILGFYGLNIENLYLKTLNKSGVHEYIKIMHEQYNIECQYTFKGIEDIAIDKIESNISSGNFVIAGLKLNNIPWDYRYNTTNDDSLTHCIIINKYSENFFSCYDPNYGVDNIELEYTDFIDGVIFVGIFEKKETAIEMYNKDGLDLKFTNEISNLFNSNTIDNNDYDKSINEIYKIHDTLIRIVLLLNYYINKEKNFEMFDLIDRIIFQLNLLSKDIKYDQRKISRKTSLIYDYTKSIQSIWEYIITMLRHSICDSKNKSINYLNLEAFYNNYGFYNFGIKKSNFDGKYNCIYGNEKQATYIEDNIVCLGQLIPVSGLRQNKIIILCCSDKGKYHDNLIIYYSNNSFEKVSIIFDDWLNSESILDKYEYKRINYNTKKINGSCYIFKIKIYLNESNSIKAIELPMNPKLHIFYIGEEGNKK